MKIEYTVLNEDNNKTVKDILKNKLHISSSLLIPLKNNNCIFVNNDNVFVNHVVKTTDVVTVIIQNIDNESIPPYNSKLNILFEDEYLLIVDKPPYLECHPALNNYDKTLANMVINYYIEKKYNINKVHILTRLDKNTSGICVIAKNEYIQNLFNILKDKIDFKKEYTAIVNGIIKKDHDIIDANIARKQGSIIIREIDESGDYAKTEYNVISKNIEKNYTVVKILLHTGRTHQIRVHMAHIGHVLLRR